jgi:hypothetical protein
MEILGISRGFWRLSLVIGLAGLIATAIWIESIGIPIETVYTFPILFLLRIVVTCAILPAAIVLLIGWVVAGFRNSN